MTAVDHIPALAPVKTPFPKLAEPTITHSIKETRARGANRRGKKRGYKGALGKRVELSLGVRLREQLDDGAWQGARSIHDEYVTHICVFFFTNSIHAHTAQLYSFAETHEVARRATS